MKSHKCKVLVCYILSPHKQTFIYNEKKIKTCFISIVHVKNIYHFNCQNFP